MNGYSTGNKTVEYALLVTAGYTCAYGLLSPFVPSQIMGRSILPMVACCAVVLFLPCFFKKAAKIAGAAIAVVISAAALYQFFAGSVLETIGMAIQEPDAVLIQISGSITILLCVLATIASLIVFSCRKRRFAITVFWLANVAFPAALSLVGYVPNLPSLIVITGCSALLFVRSDARIALVGRPNGHRHSLRMTAFASGVMVLMLVITQLGYTGLNAIFGSTPQVNVGEVVLNVRNTLFPTTGFGDYNPNQPLGRPITQNNTLVLELQADGPFYLRGRVYDTYTGRSWRTAESTENGGYQRNMSLWPPGYFSFNGFSSNENNTNQWSFYRRAMLLLQPHRITVTTKTEGQKYLFLPGTAIGSSTDLLRGSIPLQHTYPDAQAAQPLPAGTEYSLTYWQPDVTSDVFQYAVRNTAEISASDPMASWYQQINREIQSDFGSSNGLTDRTVALAQTITQNCSDEFQKAAAIEEWLKTNCTYTLNPVRRLVAPHTGCVD